MALHDFTDSLPMLLYRAVDAVMPRFRRIFNEFGITEQQWRVLRVLADANSLPMHELSALTLVSPPSLVGIIDRLEKAGHVVRSPSSRDRRRVLLRLTQAGAELQREIAPRVGAAYAALMHEVGPRQWIRLTEGLESLAATAAETESSGNTGADSP